MIPTRFKLQTDRDLPAVVKRNVVTILQQKKREQCVEGEPDDLKLAGVIVRRNNVQRKNSCVPSFLIQPLKRFESYHRWATIGRLTAGSVRLFGKRNGEREPVKERNWYLMRNRMLLKLLC